MKRFIDTQTRLGQKWICVTDKDGEIEVMVKDNAVLEPHLAKFKAWGKAWGIDVIDLRPQNRLQRMALAQVLYATNWIVGGYENSVEDGHIEQVPDYEELFSEIYYEVLHCTNFEGFNGNGPIKEVRFAGTEFIEAHIARRLKKLGYEPKEKEEETV